MIKVVAVLNIPYVEMNAAFGILSSRRDKSFENLVRIRPTGLESKNSIYALDIISVILLCILNVLFNKIDKVITSLFNANKSEQNMKRKYSFG